MIDTQAKVRCCDVDLEALEFDGETVLCRVCGDKASGFHYGVHACEGCKGFFRRSIQQKIQYRPCLKNQECTISRVNRNRCQYCRLKKCIAVGMSRDAVRFGRVPKKEKAKILEQMQKVNLNSQTNYLSAILQNEKHVIAQTVKAHAQTCDFTREKFERFQKRVWQKPEFVTCPSNKACPLNPNPQGDGEKKWSELSDCFTPAIQCVVDFAKAIPGFTVLGQEDQVTLLKAGTFEVLLLRLACLFDVQTNTMLFVDGKLYKRPSPEDGSAGFLQESMFEFAERLQDLHLTDDEMGIFSAIVLIASNRPGLRNPEHVERIQNKLSQGLQTLTRENHPDDPSLFGKLLMKIPDLRTLNTLHSEKLLGMSQSKSNSSSSDVAPPITTLSNGLSAESSSSCPFTGHVMDQRPSPYHQSFQAGSLISNTVHETIIPNINKDLPSYHSQLELVKKIKKEMKDEACTSRSACEPTSPVTTDSWSAESIPDPRHLSSVLKNRQTLKNSSYPVDVYLQASMMSHLKDRLMRTDKDRFHTMRGILNTNPQMMLPYSPYYPYMYQNEMYSYYGYQYPPPLMNMSAETRLTESHGEDIPGEARFRDRSPVSPRSRLNSTGSRNSSKSSCGATPSRCSPSSWTEHDGLRYDGSSPCEVTFSPPAAHSSPRQPSPPIPAHSSPRQQSPPVEILETDGPLMEPLNLCKA